MQKQTKKILIINLQYTTQYRMLINENKPTDQRIDKRDKTGF